MAADGGAGPAGSVAAFHEVPVSVTALVAPATTNQLNTIRLALVPIACWRLNDKRFAFGSSLLAPEMATDIGRLAALVRSHPDAPASVFGHADPVGDDGFNKRLSGRRATAIYALLTRNVDLWEELHTSPLPGDAWGLRAVQTMLTLVTRPDGAPYYDGPADGVPRPTSTQAIRAFQYDESLAADGDPGPKTRRALFAKYMDALCTDATGEPFRMDAKTQFLARGDDPDGKGDLQGCSEFNPVLVFSQSDAVELAQQPDHTARNRKNEPNRRVVVYLFRPGTRVTPDDWPCPRAKESTSGCTSQFWPDGDARRSPTSEEREYKVTRNTMACRFYDRFARMSPCEGVERRDVHLRLLDSLRRPMPNAAYKLKLGRRQVSGNADGAGFVRLEKVVPPALCMIEWQAAAGDPANAAGFPYRKEMFLATEQEEPSEALRHRLHNLGYHRAAPLEDCVRLFQQEHGLEVNGDPSDGPTVALVASLHEAMAPTPGAPPQPNIPDDFDGGR